MTKYAPVAKILKLLEQHAIFFDGQVEEDDDEIGEGAAGRPQKFLCRDVKATLEFYQNVYNKTHDVSPISTRPS